MRRAQITRNTKETQIELTLELDGSGQYCIESDYRFFNHMLEQFSAHGLFDINLKLNSLDKNSHHAVEDVGIALGQAFREALGDKKGIKRYGSMHLPMDEALVLAVVDLSGRAFCSAELNLKDERTDDFETVLLSHFFASFAQNAGASVHIKLIEGADTHHIIEASFKAFARALKEACRIDENSKDKIPSTKGVL